MVCVAVAVVFANACIAEQESAPELEAPDSEVLADGDSCNPISNPCDSEEACCWEGGTFGQYKCQERACPNDPQIGCCPAGKEWCYGNCVPDNSCNCI